MRESHNLSRQLLVRSEATLRHSFRFVVFASAHTLCRQCSVQVLTTIRPRLNPLFDRSEHGTMDLAILIADGGMVEHPDDVVKDLLLRYFDVIPCVDDSRRAVLQDLSSDLASGLVQYVGEVIFRQHTGSSLVLSMDMGHGLYL